MTSSSGYGTLGLDIGWFGRWSRFVYGILVMSPILFFMIGELNAGRIPFVSAGTQGLIFLGWMALYFGGIVAVYVGVYYALGPRVFNRGNAWLNTGILVGPALVVLYWNFLIGPLSGIFLPLALLPAMTVYVGVSLILEWRIRYGGCEVVAIPIILLKKRYQTYCLPIVAADAVEKAIVDRKAKTIEVVQS